MNFTIITSIIVVAIIYSTLQNYTKLHKIKSKLDSTYNNILGTPITNIYTVNNINNNSLSLCVETLPQSNTTKYISLKTAISSNTSTSSLSSDNITTCPLNSIIINNISSFSNSYKSISITENLFIHFTNLSSTNEEHIYILPNNFPKCINNIHNVSQINNFLMNSYISINNPDTFLKSYYLKERLITIGIYIQISLMVITRGFGCFYIYVFIVKGLKFWNWDSLTKKLDYIEIGICIGMIVGYGVNVGIHLGSFINKGNEGNDVLIKYEEELKNNLIWCIWEIVLLGVYVGGMWFNVCKRKVKRNKMWKRNGESEVIELGWKSSEKNEGEESYMNNISEMGLLDSNIKG